MCWAFLNRVIFMLRRVCYFWVGACCYKRKLTLNIWDGTVKQLSSYTSAGPTRTSAAKFDFNSWSRALDPGSRIHIIVGYHTRRGVLSIRSPGVCQPAPVAVGFVPYWPSRVWVLQVWSDLQSCTYSSHIVAAFLSRYSACLLWWSSVGMKRTRVRTGVSFHRCVHFLYTRACVFCSESPLNPFVIFPKW